jgi:hypothetical protein
VASCVSIKTLPMDDMNLLASSENHDLPSRVSLHTAIAFGRGETAV